MRVLRPIARIWTIWLGLLAVTVLLALALRIVLPLVAGQTEPTVTAIKPGDGAVDVRTRSDLAITFNQPMNRLAVERALRIEPPIAATYQWRSDGRMVQINPLQPLVAGSEYTIRIEQTALGRWWQPLAAPFQARFRTARAPSIVAALPNAAATPTDSAIALVFEVPMVAADQLDQPLDLPQLQIEPPVAGVARWIDPQTLLYQPATALRPATRYTATLAAGLTDLRGTELDRPFSWSWQTAEPQLLNVSPTAATSWVAPDQPLTLELARPLSLPQLTAGLQISPTVTGELTASLTLSGTQLITFTPRPGWEFDTRYEVTFAPTTPATAAVARWSFTVQPAPGLIARFPGQGQLLPPGQNVRLVFTTPMDVATLQAGLQLEPASDALTVDVRDTEVRLSGDLRAATAYTLTLTSQITDRNGVRLGRDIPLSFVTSPAAPAISLPDTRDRFVVQPPDEPTTLTVDRINISRLDFALYQLDAATLLRAAEFNPATWRTFQPERYNQPLLRTWSLSLSDPPNQPVRATLPITIDERMPLDPGAYYLRISSVEGAEAATMLLVSPLTLTLLQTDTQVAIWATDGATGAPLADLPLTFYYGSAVIERGRTDASGLWQFAHRRRSGSRSYLALAEGPQLALVYGDWALTTSGSPPEPARRPVVLTDRAVYAPGERITIGGFVPQARNNTGLPPTTRLDLRLVAAAAETSIGQIQAPVAADGGIAAELALPPETPPGAYVLRATFGGAVTELPLLVRASAAALDVTFDQTPGAELLLRAAAAGLPIAGAQVDWQVTTRFVDPAIDASPPAPQTGSGRTDPAGTLAIPLPTDSALTGTLHYTVGVTVSEPGGPQVQAFTSLVRAPDGPQVELRLAERVVVAGNRPVVEVVARTADGDPAPATPVVLNLYRRAATGSPPLLTRRVTTDALGRATTELVALNGGVYRVEASAGTATNSQLLWVAAANVSDWGPGANAVQLVADQTAYQPGDTARLLVTQPFASATALVALSWGEQLRTSVQELRAGELLEIPIDATMAPAVNVAVTLIEAGADRAQAPVLAGATSLRVAARPDLTLTLSADRNSYSPGATAVVTATIGTAAGGPLPATVLLGIYDAALQLEPAAVAHQLVPTPDPPVIAQFAVSAPPDLLLAAPAAAQQDLPPLYLLQQSTATGSDGRLVARIQLPQQAGRWRLMALAVGAGQTVQAGLPLELVQPLQLQVAAPSALRPGDNGAVQALIRNSDSQTRTLRVTLHPAAAVAAGAPRSRTISVPPQATTRVDWPITAPDGARVRLQVRMTETGQPPIVHSLTLPLLQAAEPLAPTAPGLVVAQELRDPLDGTPLDPAALTAGRLVEVRLNLVTAQALPASEVRAVVPAGLLFVAAAPPPAFERVAPAGAQSTTTTVGFFAAELPPGVYTLTYLARVAAAGVYTAPAPLLVTAGEAGPRIAGSTVELRASWP